MATERSASEVKARCRVALNRPDIMSLVDDCRSPTAAYDIIMAETDSTELAKAGRWLAILRRDYPTDYAKVMNPQPITKSS